MVTAACLGCAELEMRREHEARELASQEDTSNRVSSR